MLKYKVEAVNESRRKANELYDMLVPIFKPLVGQKVTKKDGSLLASIKLPELGRDVYHITSEYSLAWCVKVCVLVPPSGCVYHSTSVYVGTLNNQVLESIHEPENFRCDYTPEEVEQKRNEYKRLEREAEAAHDAVRLFER